METAGVEPVPSRCKREVLSQSASPKSMRTGGVEPPQPEAPRLQRGELSPCSASAWIARVGFEPTSRAHEARERCRSSTAQRNRSGRQESNLRSPVPKTGGLPAPLQPVAMPPGRARAS